MLSQTLGISSNVTLWTDHRNILHVLKQGSNATGMKGNDRLMRWALKLSQWPDLKVRYQPGPRNEVADGLSRLYSDAKATATAALQLDDLFISIDELPMFSANSAGKKTTTCHPRQPVSMAGISKSNLPKSHQQEAHSKMYTEISIKISPTDSDPVTRSLSNTLHH